MSFLYSCGICCMLLSIWGVIQLFIMGIFYKIEATTMIEDAMEHSYTDYDDFIQKTKANFHKVAINCWIASGIYLLMIGISVLCIMKARSNEKRVANELTDDDLFCTAQDDAQRKKTWKEG